MSLLNEIPVRTTDAEKKARRIEFLTKQIVKEINRSWNEIHDLIWRSNPNDVLEALGDNAEDVLNVQEEIFILLSKMLSGKQQSEVDKLVSKVASTPDTKIDEDGNVRII